MKARCVHGWLWFRCEDCTEVPMPFSAEGEIAVKVSIRPVMIPVYRDGRVVGYYNSNLVGAISAQSDAARKEGT